MRGGVGIVDSQNNYRAGVMDDIATDTDASGLLNLVGGDPESRAAVHGAGRNQSSFGMGTLRGGSLRFCFRFRSRRFRHRNNIEHAWLSAADSEVRNAADMMKALTLGSAILPGMPGKKSAKPRIALIGAGNLAGALASSLHAAGFLIEQVVSRAAGASLQRAKRLAAEVNASATVLGRDWSNIKIHADVVWFCVPDGAIAGVAKSLATAIDWTGKVALHSSGALTSAELAVLRKHGAALGSAHPLMTFVRGSRPTLAGVPFAIEGDRRAVQATRAIVKSLGADPYSIRAKDKAAYHAWGTFVSPLFTALLATSEHVALCAGVKRSAARQRMLPILKQTLANYEALGAAGAFSGPIVRADVGTVKQHLIVLRGVPLAQQVYVALARAALAYLPTKNRKMVERALKSAQRGGSRG